MIQSTRGMSRPRAATSVQRRMPEEALQNSKKVFVRFCCFCLPWESDIVKMSIGETKLKVGTYVEIQDGHINIIKQFTMILDRITAREKHDDLLLHMFLQKRKKQQKPPVARTHDVSLGKRRDRRCGLFVVDVDVEGTGAQGHACEVGDFGGLGCGEEHGLPVFCGWVSVSWDACAC